MNKLPLLAMLFFFSCGTNNGSNTEAAGGSSDSGSIERMHPALDAIVANNTDFEIIAEGFEWSEGPLWIEQHNMLLFSDVPRNTIYKWTANKGKEVYLTPSGYTGTVARGGETGSNGLALNPAGKLVLCQHGNRQVAWMDADLLNPQPNFKPIANNYEGKKFNSPNDVTFDKQGNAYFTDPPYGLEKNADDPLKEIPFQGVYKATPSGKVTLITDSITRPNGIAITPDGRTLIVANSDPSKAMWYAFDINGDSVTNGRVFYDATAEVGKGKGLPDGLKIDSKGNIYATGPGGIWIFNKDAKLLGRARFREATSNCALSADEKTLYVTADMYVLRLHINQ
ncbi:MAG TPA: SMP-30/gluconolactonase/LRE family protein [Chitinophagaceae bacterium]|nr:SMP-30/gluconolactonase/LRE family protein [Chitinophagaceae bacterium]